MGLMQKAVETYVCHQKYAGVYRENHAVLAPVAHIVTRASLEIILDSGGNFCGAATVGKEEPKILIPATEGSAGRAGKVICAHPLCDQLGYLSPCFKEKYHDYVTKLEKWSCSSFSHPKLLPILTYVRKGCILDDLKKCGLIVCNPDGTPQNEKLVVRWRVLNVGEEDACWKDSALIQAFINYYQSLNEDSDQGICMITGKITRIAQQHPKGIVAFNGNAKLISANDEHGFTFRGRFKDDRQALTVGYEASQLAHNALRWLVSEQGERASFGGRTFLCWNPRGKKVCTATGAFMRWGSVITQPTDYRRALSKTLEGYQSELPDAADVVIAAFDAATSGRLSLTYYNELLGSDFLQRLYEWDLHCAWPTYKMGIQSPPLSQIISSAYGNQQRDKSGAKLVTDDGVMRQQMQRLVACRIDCAPIPTDLVQVLLRKASNLLLYEKNIRRIILITACAVVRKYRFDRFKEEWEMVLEPEKRDLSYQFGRLLAVLEKVERDTYEGDSERETNAMRQQSVFCQRPMYAASNIEKQLERAYFPRLKSGSRIFYKNLIGEIMEKINQFPQQLWNKPLKETYLMGYYLQRNQLYTKQNQNQEEEKNG